ncbi:hypothetical protein [Echinococcus multilocularis]|uniref:Uncharacterized protein n=1 Tax=Echinococcus multilocularis TaxID=6211 RepID=A0A068Y1B3_ECHMU|nr:hypothetical protein [Echinococcus multilocularis]
MRRKEHFLPLKPSKHSKKWIHEEVQACYSRTRDGEMSEVNYDKCADVEESSWVGDFARASEVDECQREATTSDTTDATTFYPPMKSKHNGDLHPGNAPAVPPRPTRSECADVKESTRVGDIAEPHAFNGDPPASCTSDKTDATAISSLKYSKPSEYVDVDEVRRIVGFERPPAHLNAEEYLLPLNASEILPRSTSGEKQFNGNTHKHEAMVKKSTEGVSKDTPGTHPRSSTQARFNWKKATTLLVSASRFMEGVKKDVKFDPLQQKTTYPSPQAAGGVHCSSADERLSGTWKEMLVPSIDELKI